MSNEHKRQQTDKTETGSCRQILTRMAERRRKMRECCAGYNRQPIIEMTDEEVQAFAGHQAAHAQRSLRLKEYDRIREMNAEESKAYASAVAGSIAYFNSRDKEHRQALQYRADCNRQRIEEQIRREEEYRRKNNERIVIHII